MSMAGAAIALAVWVGYFNSFDVPYLFDDERNISQNPAIKIDDLSWSSLRQAAFGGPTARPLAYLTFALNEYFGDGEVWGYHLVNTVVHGLTGVCVFLLARLLIVQLEPKAALRPDWIALMAALLFVLHPVQTQAVTYIVQRMASLCALCYLAALVAYVHGRLATRPGRRWVWWSLTVGMGMCALATKQNAVTLPLAILLVEWIFFRGGQRGWGPRGWTMIAIGGLMIGLIAWAFRGSEFPWFPRGYAQRDFTMWERVLTQGRVMVHYLTLVAWPLPSRLTFLYDFPVSKSLVQPVTTLVAWTGLTALVVYAWRVASSRPLISFAILWFFLHLAVESSILPLELIYEHRLYLPLFGVCLAVSAGIFRAMPSLRAAMLLGAVLIGLLGWGTHLRNETWRDAIRFWKDSIAKQPTEHRSTFNLAMAYANENEFAEAQRWLDRTLELNPRSQVAYHSRALTHEIYGDEAAALADYSSAIAIPREFARGTFTIRDSLIRRGRLLLKREQFAAASADFEEAIKMTPREARGYLERATVNVYRNRPQAVIADFVRATQVEPDLVEAHDKLAWYLATYPDDQIARPQLALQHATRACELSDWQAYSPLGTLAAVHARLGDFEQAVHWQQQCLAVAPPDRLPAMQGRLGLYQQGQPMLERYPPPR